MNYRINLGGWNSVFAVPSAVVDNYIKIASGNAIKVLLFFLRNTDVDISVNDIAKALAMKDEDVSDSLVFWEQIGLLSLNENQLAPTEQQILFKKNPQQQPQEQPSPMPLQPNMNSVRKVELQRQPEFAPIDIAKKVKESDQIEYLFKTCEGLYGRTLKHTEQNALMVIMEHAGLPVEVTLMMVEYCFSINKSSPANMRNLALEWADKEINTLERAEQEIRYLKNSHSAQFQIKSMFEIDRALSQKERNFIDVWVNHWNMPYELINLAYQYNVDSKGKYSFPYMNKILESWHEKGYTDKAQVEQERENYRQENTNESSFDIDDIDRMTLDEFKRNQK